MNIGFDLDKIFVDYPPFIPDKIIDKLYKKKVNGVLLYRIPRKPEQFVRKLSHLPIFRPKIQKNIDFLKDISRDKHKLYLISSRFGFLENETLRLMQKLGFDKVFSGLYFNFQNLQPHIFKNDLMKKLKIDMYVDDDLPLLEYIAKNNKNTKFFWLNKNPDKIVSEKNIFSIPRISDILKTL